MDATWLTGRSKESKRSTLSGKTAEDIIAAVLTSKGVKFEPQAQIGRNIYQKVAQVDFLVPTCQRFPKGLIIESKWQQVPGTNEEKFPYLVLNIHQCYPFPTMIVYGGEGWTPGAIEWIRAQVDGRNLVAVLSIEEFTAWANTNL